jgi:hypothetical protein
VKWRRQILLTEPPLVLDADFVSSFAWVDRIDILERLYSKRMVLLDEVMNELNRVPHIASRVQVSVDNGAITRIEIYANAPEALELGKLLEVGKYGRGEAACMAYLMLNKGTMGSNNLSDVKTFCLTNHKCLLTTADVFAEAYEARFIRLDEADSIWIRMISKKRKLPTSSFSEYLAYLATRKI